MAAASSSRTTDVLWITPTYPWREAPAFGIFYQNQARAVDRRGVSVTVGCATPWAPWPLSRLHPRWRRYASAPPHTVDAGISIIRPRYVNVPGEPSWARPDRLIANAIERSRDDWTGAKLIHGHYAITGMAARLVAERADLPFVLTFHGSDMNEWPQDHPERLTDLRDAVSKAGAVFAVSQALADRVKSVTGVEAVHLPLGSDHREMAAKAVPRAEARERLGLEHDRIIVLFVGNLKRAKGVRELADAVLLLGRPFLGVFVGEGPEDGYGLADPRADGVLDYRGAVTHDQVIEYLGAADVLVLPSYGEGLPTVLVEAGSLRVPVIASRVGGIPELLEPDRGTLLPDVAPASIAAAVTMFADQRDVADEAAERLHDHVLRLYDVDRNTSTLLEVYRSLAPGIGPDRGGPAAVGGPGTVE